MKITLVVATSKDGFINHLGQKHASDWTSPEDHKHFREQLSRYKLQIMGLNTYNDNKDGMKNNSFHRRVIFTHTPEKNTAIPGVLEFTNSPIEEVLQQLEEDGFKHALLVGGGILFTEFLDAGLVDTIELTIEPLEFGEGVPFLTDGHTLSDYTYLALEERTPLNNSGTVLLHYVRK